MNDYLKLQLQVDSGIEYCHHDNHFISIILERHDARMQ